MYMTGADSLFSEDWYRKCYSDLAMLIRSRSLPQMRGTPAQINAFLNNLILNQRGRDWNRLFDFMLDELGLGYMDAEKINMMIRSRPLSAFARPEIAQHAGLGQGMLSLERKPVTFIGTGQEAMEFLLRFLLSQTTGEWLGALHAVVRKCSGFQTVKLSELNRILTVWDYTRLFDRSMR
jgi:hypothetical protein